MNTIKKLFLISSFLLFSSSAFAEGSDKQIEALVFTCYTCHGTDGSSPGDIPTLKGLTAAEITEKLTAFQKDENDPTIMNRIAKGYSENEIKQIADYLAAIK